MNPNDKNKTDLKKEKINEVSSQAYSNEVKSPLFGSTLLGQTTQEIGKNKDLSLNNDAGDELKEEVKVDQAAPVVSEVSAGTESIKKEELPKAEETTTSQSELSNGESKGKSIADILAKQGLLKPDQLDELKYAIANKQGSEEELIVSKGWVDKIDLLKAKASSFGVPYIDLTTVEIPRELLTRLPYESAKAYQAILFKEDTEAHIGMVDPLDIQGIRYLEAALGKTIKPYFASEEDVRTILDTRYGGKIQTEVGEAIKQVEDE